MAQNNAFLYKEDCSIKIHIENILLIQVPNLKCKNETVTSDKTKRFFWSLEMYR